MGVERGGRGTPWGGHPPHHLHPPTHNTPHTQLDASAGETAADARKRKRLARDPLRAGVITERAPLRAREEDVDLAADLGRKRSVTAGAAPAGQAGYYCSVCDCVLKDSKGWLDHVNGKWHNRALGMSMRVDKVGVDDVKARLAALAAKKQGEKGKGGGGDDAERIDPESAAGARLAAAQTAEARAVAVAKARREAKKAAAKAAKEEEGEEGEEDDEAAAMAAAMGFGGFGGGK